MIRKGNNLSHIQQYACIDYRQHQNTRRHRPPGQPSRNAGQGKVIHTGVPMLAAQMHLMLAFMGAE